MLPSEKLQITDKGREEMTRRIYSLSLKKRSLLILLSGNPKSVETLSGKGIFLPEEFSDVLNSLINEGFIQPENPHHVDAPKPKSSLFGAPRINASQLGTPKIDSPLASKPEPLVDRAMIDVWKF